MDAVDATGRTALMLAIEHDHNRGDIEVVEALLQNGADLRKPDANGDLPMDRNMRPEMKNFLQEYLKTRAER